MLSHYSLHKETTECASLSGGHCITSIHLLKETSEIMPRAKNRSETCSALLLGKVCRRGVGEGHGELIHLDRRCNWTFLVLSSNHCKILYEDSLFISCVLINIYLYPHSFPKSRFGGQITSC